jgi:hypothetical protein
MHQMHISTTQVSSRDDPVEKFGNVKSDEKQTECHEID